MRDSSRIPLVLAAVHNLWKRNPDLRLGQILIGAASKAGHSVVCPELFYIEDDVLLHGLEKFHDKALPEVSHCNVDDLWERFHSESPPAEVKFRYNQHVLVTKGEFQGCQGFIIDLKSLTPEPIYRVERMDTGHDIFVSQQSLELVG